MSLWSLIHYFDTSAVLNTQLIQRNEELEKLYEKLKIQQSKLLHGEAEYKSTVQGESYTYVLVCIPIRVRSEKLITSNIGQLGG